MKTILTFIIGLYQKTLSPDHGIFRWRFPYGYCRFYPTCSQYGKEAINTHGSIKGVYLATKRVLSCNPWHQGGIDAVPPSRAILRHE